MKRIEALDYLRGLMAVSVMVYHYVSWATPSQNLGSESLLGKLGTYAVSIFYILSGLSLSLVYKNKLSSRTAIRSYFIKRIFRIFPLFWICTTITLAYKYAFSIISGEPFIFPWYKAILNYSLTFGFIDNSAYLTTGAWSIGNEMVFYLILPFILFLNKLHTKAIIYFFIITLCLGLYFSYFCLDDSLSLSATQWPTYINPFNQMFLFAGGMMIATYGKFSASSKNKVLLLTFLIIAILIFIFLPSSGDQINIVTGINRIALSTASFLLVYSIFMLNPKIKRPFSKSLSFLGESCYSIYLLHPLVAFPTVFLLTKFNISTTVSYVISAIFTLFASWLSFRFIEKPAIGYGKKFAAWPGYTTDACVRKEG